MREPEGMSDGRAIGASPFGHGALTAKATEPCATRQGQNRRQGMALATRLAKVRDIGEHLDERTGLCYHGNDLDQRVWDHEDVPAKQGHMEQNPWNRLASHGQP